MAKQKSEDEGSATPTLLCIPDISGFTEFMGSTNFEMSSKVIPSLLNKIVYSNEIGMKISEIEGDAVLFYRHGELPPFEDLMEQCHFIYTEFYKQMEVLRKEHAEKGGEKIPEILGLKIVLHYGKEIGSVPVGTRIKLMGEDVIVAHRILKNDIESNEYILITQTLLDIYGEANIIRSFDWGEMQEGGIEVEHLGTVNFNYIDLN